MFFGHRDTIKLVCYVAFKLTIACYGGVYGI